MDFVEYKTLVGIIPVGKKLPDAVYLHESALDALPEALATFLARVVAALDLDQAPWNLVKFFKRDFKLALLNYPGFFDDAYPSLHQSYSIDLATGAVRTTEYMKSDNPPILHRKETFLKPDHALVRDFQDLTREAETAGLYEKPRSIGFKKSWERLISHKGYVLDPSGRLQPKCDQRPQRETHSPDIDVERHLTAIDRDRLSAPMQLLARHSYLDGRYSIFDYGCGKGDDIRELEAHGLDATGWDPVYASQASKRKADIVNLGFVINVIEDRMERDKVLRDAYQHANKALAVSAMLAGEALISQFKPYKDGIVTSRNTFQKYYSQSELRSYIESTLDEPAIAAAPGIFLVFRDKDEEQLFLSERQRSRREWKQLSTRERTTPVKTVTTALIEKNQELFDDFWHTCLDLGRVPANSEFEFTQRVRSIARSHAKAFDALKGYYGEEAFDVAKNARRSDLLVYFALGLFGRRKPYRHMPDGLKRDLKAFFGNYANAIEEARELLFSIASSDKISTACEDALEILKCGVLHAKESYTFHRAYLNELPAILRVYVGCAAQLYGDLDDVQLIKVHIGSGKVSMMTYLGFADLPIPELTERTKINLREQEIEVFSYTGQYAPQPLYLKSRYLRCDARNYDNQTQFDQNLERLGLFDFNGYGPSHEEFLDTLATHGLHVVGYELAPLA
jgi:DNA phosphorothioation-associated putative methyltransferase